MNKSLPNLQIIPIPSGLRRDEQEPTAHAQYDNSLTQVIPLDHNYLIPIFPYRTQEPEIPQDNTCDALMAREEAIDAQTIANGEKVPEVKDSDSDLEDGSHWKNWYFR